MGEERIYWPLTSMIQNDAGQITIVSIEFYHNIDKISDLSQSKALNLVMWRVRVMQATTRLLGYEVVVGSSLMFRKMDPWNVIRK